MPSTRRLLGIYKIRKRGKKVHSPGARGGSDSITEKFSASQPLKNQPTQKNKGADHRERRSKEGQGELK